MMIRKLPDTLNAKGGRELVIDTTLDEKHKGGARLSLKQSETEKSLYSKYCKTHKNSLELLLFPLLSFHLSSHQCILTVSVMSFPDRNTKS